VYGDYFHTKGISTETSPGSSKHSAIGDDDHIQKGSFLNHSRGPRCIDLKTDAINLKHHEYITIGRMPWIISSAND